MLSLGKGGPGSTNYR